MISFELCFDFVPNRFNYTFRSVLVIYFSNGTGSVVVIIICAYNSRKKNCHSVVFPQYARKLSLV